MTIAEVAVTLTLTLPYVCVFSSRQLILLCCGSTCILGMTLCYDCLLASNKCC